MRPRSILSFLLFTALFLSAQSVGKTARELIDEIPERSGGIYYAYPCVADSMPALPGEYRVSFISHYGRHGSRWLIKMWEYDEAIAALDSADACGGLTPLGSDVLRRLRVAAAQARGKAGALSPKGEKQHRDIAARMMHRFPALFADSARIEAFSSTEPRCIMSMAAFCESLKNINGSLKIQRYAYPGDMSFISWSNQESKAINNPDAPWWNELEAFRDSVLDPSRLMASLFIRPCGISSPKRLMWILHDVAVGVQDTDPGVELLDIFTSDELYALWQALNYKMYYLHGNNPATVCAGPRSARSLLDHIIADTDSAALGLRDTGRVATLRFGHDSALLRLLALMKIEGAAASVDNPDDYADAWRDFSLTPMAANLQIALLSSESGAEPLVLIRLNEQPARLPLESDIAPFYRWSAVKQLWENKQ